MATEVEKPNVNRCTGLGRPSDDGSDSSTFLYSCPQLVYFSSVSENTHRFVEKLHMAARKRGDALRSSRLPVKTAEDTVVARRPFVLISPTYGGATLRGHVPKQVIKFLNIEQNRDLLVGVIGSGNTNFGKFYCLAGDIIAQKCKVPHLYRFELMGLPDDVERIREGLEQLWARQSWKK